MPRLVAALDADVLVPILSGDFLLTAFDLGLYEPVVSTEAIVEAERNLIEDFPHLDPARLRGRVGQMRDALDDHLVDPGSVDDLGALNPKDRHVIAAALAGEASIVVTNDKRYGRARDVRADQGLRANGLVSAPPPISFPS